MRATTVAVLAAFCGCQGRGTVPAALDGGGCRNLDLDPGPPAHARSDDLGAGWLGVELFTFGVAGGELRVWIRASHNTSRLATGACAFASSYSHALDCQGAGVLSSYSFAVYPADCRPRSAGEPGPAIRCDSTTLSSGDDAAPALDFRTTAASAEARALPAGPPDRYASRGEVRGLRLVEGYRWRSPELPDEVWEIRPRRNARCYEVAALDWKSPELP